MILDDHFWADVKFVVDFIEPVNDVICFADTDSSYLGEIYECIDSMCERIKTVTDARDTTLYPHEEATLIREHFASFIRGAGKFGYPQSLRDRSKIKNPINWWTIHGKHAPELKSLAARLLAQVVSSSSCERNWSTYSFIHSVKRNRLGSKKVENLVFKH
eukprot:Gb_12097 [translate_table: standard]